MRSVGLAALSLGLVCSSSFPQVLIHVGEHLYVQGGSWLLCYNVGKMTIGTLHPFIALKDPYISITYCVLGIHATYHARPASSTYHPPFFLTASHSLFGS
ncbi:hypothetical protein DFH94DRAFT_773851 [Russula ochroleuca]|uniref:Secreted protein n=1 Tax=Russula ochroleuca TaxID=152965 RepID=A0A9P5JYS2_9AGAM|nr:hypothetical protein DFH94DRAFT_773851 [Russula ochroleuca]